MRVGEVCLIVLLVAVISVVPTASDAKELTPPQHPPRHEIRIPEPTPPLNESELTHIILPQSWLLKNKSEDPNLVKVSFPAAWLENPPKAIENKPVVLLRVPKELLKTLDTSDEPKIITVTLPKDEFEFYSDISEI